MCVDYTNLNKACPIDPFLPPHIDQVVDPSIGCELLSFLDTYSGYHQIPLTKEDQATTTFITPFKCFYYAKMSIRLKNVRATYQRCMQSCFMEQIRHNLKVYIDDIIIKTQQGNSLILDLEETFTNLR
jgi:hypothetical protein